MFVHSGSRAQCDKPVPKKADRLRLHVSEEPGGVTLTGQRRGRGRRGLGGLSEHRASVLLVEHTPAQPRGTLPERQTVLRVFCHS